MARWFLFGEPIPAHPRMVEICLEWSPVTIPAKISSGCGPGSCCRRSPSSISSRFVTETFLWKIFCWAKVIFVWWILGKQFVARWWLNYHFNLSFFGMGLLVGNPPVEDDSPFASNPTLSLLAYRRDACLVDPGSKFLHGNLNMSVILYHCWRAILRICQGSQSSSGQLLRYFLATGKPYYRPPETYIPGSQRLQVMVPPGMSPGQVALAYTPGQDGCHLRMDLQGKIQHVQHAHRACRERQMLTPILGCRYIARYIQIYYNLFENIL